MSEKKTLVLHIGTHKTGTTFLQSTFAQNHQKFLENSVLYPVAGRIYEAHFKLCWELRKPEHAHAQLLEIPIWRDLVDEIIRSPANLAVVSSEEFSFSINPERLRPLKEIFDVKVICFVRSPDSFMQSFYNQFVKDFITRESRTISQYVAEEPLHFLNYRRTLSKWLKVFGREAMVVQDFSLSAKRQSLLHDFLSSIGVSKPKDLKDPAESILQKVSLPPDILEYLRLANPYFRQQEGHHAFVVDLVKIARRFDDHLHTTRGGILSLKARRALRVRFADQNIWLAKTFWDQSTNPFHPDEAPPPPDDFDLRPEQADASTLGRIAALLREA